MSQESFDRLVQVVQETMTRQHVPGVAVGVVAGDQIYTTGLGVTSVDNPLDVTDETLFQIGSVTKTYTATAVMRLVEMGKLDLDAPVRHYLPDFKVADESVAAMVTVRHLVTHSAGWEGDIFTDTGTNDDALKRYVEQLAAVEQLAPPDTLFSYNNAAFAVAGRLIEIVTGKPYEAAMQELVFTPMGLERSFFFARDLLTFRFASGHVVIEDQPRVQRPWAIPRSSNAAGGIVCTVKDVLRYARFHMGDGTAEDGTRLLSPESMQLMQTPQFPAGDEEGAIGLAWMIRPLGEVKTIQHGGGTLGQICLLILAPTQKFAVAILTNCDSGGQVTAEGTKFALKEFLQVDDTLPTPIEATEEQLKGYVGKYDRPSLGLDVTLTDGHLFLQIIPKVDLGQQEKPPSPPPIRLAMCREDQFLVMEGVYKNLRVEFIRQQDGTLGWLRIGARINRRVVEA
ncbi:MAG: beta-lactamase family protein [Chloroflexi bacterium]|nr:beta-lactamase family protein [Chloroflexota bacterium]